MKKRSSAKRNTKTKAKPSPTALERWERLVPVVIEKERGEAIALEALMDIVSDAPRGMRGDTIESWVTAHGAIRVYDLLDEISGPCEHVLAASKANVLSWLTSQANGEAEHWPLDLISLCLHDGPQGWARIFERFFRDHEEGLARLEDAYIEEVAS
jgi:hypothetical protein